MTRDRLARGAAAVLSVCALAACTHNLPETAATTSLPSLPQPVANNAVAAVNTAKGQYLVTFLGLGAGKTHADISAHAYALAPDAPRWHALPPPPGTGRLAATAVAVGETVYLIGGYTVAADGSEKSIETVHAVDVIAGTYRELPPMPVPVDDALSVVYQKRYVYLISGWHDTGNVNLVQVLDTHTQRWFQSTPFPGAPVFGHAGGISGNELVVCDGVRIQTTAGRRVFAAQRACYHGRIDPENLQRIDWTTLPHFPGKALYRAAAAGAQGQVVFAGGSDNPYNFSGVGYNGVPSAPSDAIHVFDLPTRQWRAGGRLQSATMDHRGLLQKADGRWVIVGGMRDRQVVSDQVTGFALLPQ